MAQPRPVVLDPSLRSVARAGRMDAPLYLCSAYLCNTAKVASTPESYASSSAPAKAPASAPALPSSLTSASASQGAAASEELSVVDLVPCDLGEDGRCEWENALNALWKRGIRSVMVEGTVGGVGFRVVVGSNALLGAY